MSADNLVYIEFRRRLMDAIVYYAEYMRFIPFDGVFPVADNVEIEAHIFQKHSEEDTQPIKVRTDEQTS